MKPKRAMTAEVGATRPTAARSRYKAKVVWVAAAVIIPAAIWWMVVLLQPPDLSRMLGKVYGERRTIELRIPDGIYGPLQQSGQSLEKSAALWEAKTKLLSTKNVDDPVWMQMNARASLLEGNFQLALEQIDDAMMLKPNDSGLF